jgi:ribosomal-protein-alanine N-acetyltransferase
VLPSAEVSVRLVRPEDAEALSRLETENEQHLLTGAPLRSEEYRSVDGQRALIAAGLEAHAAGTSVPFVIEVDGDIVGKVTLSGIVRGALQSAAVGYWVDAGRVGRGIATEALALVVDHAFGELRLHRLQAETTLGNDASARVLVKVGFEQYGVARDYLRIGGRWQDHRMFQLLNDDWREPVS